MGTKVILAALPCIPFAFTFAQTPSKWCDYKPRTVMEISAHAHVGDSADITMSGGQFPSRVTMRYTGNVRFLSLDQRRFLRDYFTKFFQMSGADTLFRHEVEFSSSGDSTLWLPIQETMFADFQSEMQRGDTSTLFLLWAGSYRPAFYDSTAAAAHAPREHVLLINEFTSGRTRDNWNLELGSCN